MTDNSAPGELELVRELVNTCDVEGGVDELHSPDHLRSWLHERDLIPATAGVGDDDLERIRTVREALRALLYANHGDGSDAAAVDTLNDAAGRAQLVVVFDRENTSHLRPAAEGIDGAIGKLLAIVNESQRIGTWARLKACRKESCRWAFYDRSRNRSGTWCSMAVCGNRVKARTYRERQAATKS